MNYNKSIYPWVVWFLSASFFLLSYFPRIAPSIMIADFINDFGVSFQQVGLLSSLYYFSYILMQIPAGMLYDRFSSKKLILFASIVISILCMLFSYSKTIGFIYLIRFLMGGILSCAFVGAINVSCTAHPSSRRALIIGMTQALGMVGAVVANGPVSHMVNSLGWRMAMGNIGLFFLALFVLIYFFVKDKSINLKRTTTNLNDNKVDLSILSSIKLILLNKKIVINALYAGCLLAPIVMFSEMWGVSYIQHKLGISVEYAAYANSMIFLGWAIGGPIIGALSDYLNERIRLMQLFSIICFITFILVLYLPYISYSILCVLLFVFGVSNSCVGLSYTLATEIVDKKISSTSLAFTNMVSVLLGALFVPIIGWLIDILSEQTDPLQQFDILILKKVLTVIPILILVGILLTRRLKKN